MKNYKYLLLFLFAISVFIPIGVMADTFGYENDGGTTTWIALKSGPFNYSYRVGHSNYSPTLNGTLDSLHAYIANGYADSGDAGDITVFLNQKDSEGSDSHGEIGSKENVNQAVNGYNTPAWATFTISGSPSISSGANYIFNIVGDPADFTYGAIVFYDTDSNHYNYTETFTNDYAGSKENPWTVTPTEANRYYSIYATYTPGGGEGEEEPIPDMSQVIGYALNRL